MGETNYIPEGAIVQLKSGGPRMVVTEHIGAGFIHCVWFDRSNNRRTGSFSETSLRTVKTSIGEENSCDDIQRSTA